MGWVLAREVNEGLSQEMTFKLRLEGNQPVTLRAGRRPLQDKMRKTWTPPSQPSGGDMLSDSEITPRATGMEYWGDTQEGADSLWVSR